MPGVGSTSTASLNFKGSGRLVFSLPREMQVNTSSECDSIILKVLISDIFLMYLIPYTELGKSYCRILGHQITPISLNQLEEQILR